MVDVKVPAKVGVKEGILDRVGCVSVGNFTQLDPRLVKARRHPDGSDAHVEHVEVPVIV